LKTSCPELGTSLFEIALRSYANSDFGSEGTQLEKERRATSELTKSNFKRFTREQYKEKRADEF